MSQVIEVADAVVKSLNDPGFDPPLDAVRHYQPQFDLAELKTRRVSVVPRKLEIAALMRQGCQRDVSIDVAVQQQVHPGNLAELDGLMSLVERIADHLQQKRLEWTDRHNVSRSAIWVRTENSPIYSPEHLESKRVFTSVLTFTFRIPPLIPPNPP